MTREERTADSILARYFSSNCFCFFAVMLSQNHRIISSITVLVLYVKWMVNIDDESVINFSVEDSV